MEKALQELLDKQAIAELVHNYSRAVDRKDWALLRDLYTRDGVDDHAALFCGPADDFIKWLESASAHLDGMAHHVHSILIGVDGDAAWGEAYVTSYNRWPDGNGGFEEFVQGLRYLDNYRREGERWRFAYRKVMVDYAYKQPAWFDFTDPLLAGKRPGRFGGGDPSYADLKHPAFARGARR
jgi:hypothetical protein